jgi:peptide/nickel transport system substrate-binding protein
MQQFTPQIWKMWQDKKLPVGTWYDKPPYYIPGGMPMLVMNTTKKGLGDARVRRALAHAINYPRIAEQAMSQYSDPAQSSLILPKGADAQYFDAANVAANGWTYDTAKATQILEQELGAKKGSDGVYKLADGTRLGPWKVQTPNGWSDWQTAVQVVVESAKAAGFDLTADFPEANTLTPNVQNANFDLAVWYITGQTTAGTPWERFRDVMESRGVAAPGHSAFYNYGRFSNAAVGPLLDKGATATGDELKATLKQLDTIFMQNAPMIPLMYRPLDFFEVNGSVWKGFPTEKNPTAPPTFSGAGVLWLYDISPK